MYTPLVKCLTSNVDEPFSSRPLSMSLPFMSKIFQSKFMLQLKLREYEVGFGYGLQGEDLNSASTGIGLNLNFNWIGLDCFHWNK